MGPTVNNLDKLLRMPTGCGEQTMLGLAPDVFVTNYLSATKQLSSDIEEKAINYMEKGTFTVGPIKSPVQQRQQNKVTKNTQI
jgi:hypothetical protein